MTIIAYPFVRLMPTEQKKFYLPNKSPKKLTQTAVCLTEVRIMSIFTTMKNVILS